MPLSKRIHYCWDVVSDGNGITWVQMIQLKFKWQLCPQFLLFIQIHNTFFVIEKSVLFCLCLFICLSINIALCDQITPLPLFFFPKRDISQWIYSSCSDPLDHSSCFWSLIIWKSMTNNQWKNEYMLTTTLSLFQALLQYFSPPARWGRGDFLWHPAAVSVCRHHATGCFVQVFLGDTPSAPPLTVLCSLVKDCFFPSSATEIFLPFASDGKSFSVS